LINIRALLDKEGKRIIPNAPDLEILRLSGILYGGMSGGPVMDANGAVVGLFSGSEQEGGAVGWAIPSREILALMSTTAQDRKASEISTWPPILFNPANSRGLEQFLKKDDDLERSLSRFPAALNKLNQANQQLQNIARGGLSTNLQSAVGSLEFAGARGWPWKEEFFRRNFDQIKWFHDYVSSRVSSDNAVRQVARRLETMESKVEVPLGSMPQKISEVMDINNKSFFLIASTTFEEYHGIDASEFEKAYKYIEGSGPGSGASSDNRQLADALKVLTHASEKYGSQWFDPWRWAEGQYFDRVWQIIMQSQHFVIYVPE
jgi:hypothetical protein